MAHTLASLQVHPRIYGQIRKQLLDAGYDHAVDDMKKELDMTGIALTWGNTMPGEGCPHGWAWDDCPDCRH